MTDADFEQFIGLYLAGELDGETAARMRAYLEKTPGRQGFVAGIRGAVRSEDAGVAPEVEASRRRLMEKLGRGVDRTFARVWSDGTTNPKLRRVLSTSGVLMRENSAGHGLWGMESVGTRTLRRWGWAGGVTILVAGLLLLTRQYPETRADVTRTYATTAQQQAVINFSDGTRVTLAPQTTLRLRHFGTYSRTVVLDSGEAYFEVTHASGLPFTVQSGTATTRVLGTAFLVRHIAGDAHVRVAVMEGKVRLVASGRVRGGVTLSARQVGDITDSTTQTSTADDIAPDAEWVSGRVIFRNTALATVLRTLSQWYGYQFRYADQAIGTQKVTVMVSTHSSAEALAALERVLAVNVTVAGDTVTLVPHPPQSDRNAPRIRTYDVWTPTREVGR